MGYVPETNAEGIIFFFVQLGPTVLIGLPLIEIEFYLNHDLKLF